MMTTEEFIQKLRRPMHNYTLAMHGDTNFSDHEILRKSAATRRRNALAEIHQLTLEYVAEHSAPAQHLEKYGDRRR